MRRRSAALLLAAVAVLPLQRHPAAQAKPDQTARFGARTEAVVVDVSVVDKKGRPVTTLAQSDFEVFEDDIPQTILTFDRHVPNPNATAEDAAAELGLGGQNRASRASARGPSVTAIAFDRLSPEGRMLAYRAAKRFVQNKQADELAGVFMVDQALRTLAPYTTDPVKLSAAVEQAANTATTQLKQEQTMADKIFVTPETPMVASAEDPGRSARQLPGTDPLGNIDETDRPMRKIAEML